MISIAPLGNGAAAAEYYLRRQAGCRLDYYTGHGERPGVWCGAGSRSLGLSGELTVDGERVFRALLAGYGPDGVRLLEPVLRLDPAAKLDARPLVGAVRRTAADRGCDVDKLLTDAKIAGAFAHLARQVDRSALAAVRVRADMAEQIAHDASIDPIALYGGERFAEARSRVGQRIDVRRGGFDVVFSAPKSVSVLYGLGDERTAEQVREAQALAVREALAYLERHVARAARGHQGDGMPASRIATDGLAAAAFEHRSSRADDPQLHTHVVIANMVCGVDGRWSATNSRALYLHELTAGYMYQAVLRGELTRRLGVAWGDVRRGIAEIDGVPRPLCRAFSQRRQAIEARLASEGRQGAAAAQQVCEETRPAKSHLPEQTLREQWSTRAREFGFDPGSLRTVLGRVPSPASTEQPSSPSSCLRRPG